MGEFDLSLIREFRDRPAFYDRNCPRFKDKAFTAHQWQLIANKLGYDVSLLKDRMLQLRNRYNLEKRRLGELREENPTAVIESPWPLYNYLQFLSNHIRARRSYKRLMTSNHSNKDEPNDHSNSGQSNDYSSRVGHGDYEDDGGPSSINGQGRVALQLGPEDGDRTGMLEPFANGLVAVKMERVSDDECVPQQQPHVDIDSSAAQQQRANTHSNGPQDSDDRSQILPASITIRRLETMKANSSPQQLEQQIQFPTKRPMSDSFDDELSPQPSTSTAAASASVKKRRLASTLSTATTNAQPFIAPPPLLHFSRTEETSEQLPVNKNANIGVCRQLTAREEKYNSFGHFISASLMELPPKKALQLVKKFTAEVVNSLIVKDDDDNENATAQEDAGEDRPAQAKQPPLVKLDSSAHTNGGCGVTNGQ